MKSIFTKSMAPVLLAASMVSCSGSNGATTAEGNDSGDTLLLFVGSYSSPEDEGISLYSFDQSDGTSRRLTGMAGISNPSFLTIGRRGNIIYSVGEDNGKTSTVNAVAFNRDSLSLQLLSSWPTGGGAPCHITLYNKEGRDTHVLTANYLGGSATVYALDHDGLPVGEPQMLSFSGSGPVAGRQDTPHAHFISFTPDSSRLIVTDLGTDQLHVFPVTGDRQLVDPESMTDILLAPGSGPRHIDWHPTLPVGYLIDEIDGRINVLSLDSLAPVQSVVADSVGAQGSADIHVSPDGRFLYASNRLEADGIAIFAIDQTSGLLSYAGYQPTGLHPRNFAITPNGRFMLVACRDTDTIEIYRIDAATGELEKTDLEISVSRPVCVKFLP